MSLDDAVRARASNHCEALVRVRSVFTRCGRPWPEVHHRLLRKRGGNAMDEYGQDLYHLIALCREHHTWVHLNPEQAEKSGLYIRGQAWLEGGRLVYVGPDEYLSSRYGRNTDGLEVRSLVDSGR